MSKKKYYKTVTTSNENHLAIEMDEDKPGGVLLDLLSLEMRILEAGEYFPEVFEITKEEFSGLSDLFYLRIGRMTTLTIEEAEPSLNKEESFVPKTGYTVICKGFSVEGFTDKTDMKLLDFFRGQKLTGSPMIVRDSNGEFCFFIDASEVATASLEIEKI